MNIAMRNLWVSQKNQLKEFVLESEEEKENLYDKNGFQSNEQEQKNTTLLAGSLQYSHDHMEEVHRRVQYIWLEVLYEGGEGKGHEVTGEDG